MHASGMSELMSKLTNENHLIIISQVNSNGNIRLKVKAKDVMI